MDVCYVFFALADQTTPRGVVFFVHGACENGRKGANLVQISDTGHVIRALTIAGSDSGGGAGIQADLKTFAAFEVYGASALTALTAQNTQGVQGIYEVAPEFLRQQVESVNGDIGFDAAKIGMLGSAAMTTEVADIIARAEMTNLVLDPVMVAKGGASLLEDHAVHMLKTRLLPLATVLTPNLLEAEVLCGYPIHSWSDCQQAVSDLAKMGPQCIVLKGGHATWGISRTLPDDANGAQVFDLVFDGSALTTFYAPRVFSRKTHGTGCTLSAAIAACLARGMRVLDAIATAKTFVWEAMVSAAAWDVGTGHGPLDHSVAPRFSTGIEAGGTYRWHNDGRFHLEGIRI